MVSRGLITAEDRWLERLCNVVMYARSPHQSARDAFAPGAGLTSNLDRCRCESRRAGLGANRSHPGRAPGDSHPCCARRQSRSPRALRRRRSPGTSARDPRQSGRTQNPRTRSRWGSQDGSEAAVRSRGSSCAGVAVPTVAPMCTAARPACD